MAAYGGQMTAELCLAKRSSTGVYDIGFFGENLRMWNTGKSSRKVPANLHSNETQKWVGMRGGRDVETEGQTASS